MNKKLIFFVAGLGRFGESVATTLENMGYEVMAMDLDEDVVQNLSSTLGYVVCADASEEKKSAGYRGRECRCGRSGTGGYVSQPSEYTYP